MAFGILGFIVALSFILMVIVYATSDKKDMTLAVSLGWAVFLFVVAALFFMAERTPLGLVLMVFGIYALYTYAKIKKAHIRQEKGDWAAGSHRSGDMSEEEAAYILGVRPGAGPEEIQRAYRSLMMEYHPDREGAEDMAAKINAARDVLLR